MIVIGVMFKQFIYQNLDHMVIEKVWWMTHSRDVGLFFDNLKMIRLNKVLHCVDSDDKIELKLLWHMGNVNNFFGKQIFF